MKFVIKNCSDMQKGSTLNEEEGGEGAVVVVMVSQAK